MTQWAQEFIDKSLTVYRQSVARLGDLAVIMNAERMAYMSDPSSGVFDRFCPIGMPEPDEQPTLATDGAGNVDGDRAYVITHYDQTNDIESNPTESVEISASSNKILLTFNDNPEHPLITHRRVWRNDSDGGTTFYLVATVDVTEPTYQDDSTDATIRGTLTTVKLDNDQPETGEYDFAVSSRNYVFLIGKHHFIFSKPGNPGAYPAINKTPVENGMGGRLRLATPIGDMLVYYKDGVVYEHHWDTKPHGLLNDSDGFGKVTARGRGAINESAVANVSGVHYSFSHDGIYQSRGGTEANRMSLALEGLMRRLNWSAVDLFSAAQDGEVAYFAVTMNDGITDLECRHVFALNLRVLSAGGTGRWHLHHYPMGIRHMTELRLSGANPKAFGMNRREVVAVITERGQVGFLRSGYRDLVHPELTGEGTVTTEGSSTTFTDANATFEDGGVDVVGAPLYFDLPHGDEWEADYRVVSISGQEITYEALTGGGGTPDTVPAGTAYVIGGIRGYVKTPILGLGTPELTKVVGEAVIEYQPLGISREMYYGVEYDRKGARLAGSAFSESDREFEAVAEIGNFEIGGDLREGRLGVKKLGLPSDAFRYLQMTLGWKGVDNAVIVDKLRIDG